MDKLIKNHEHMYLHSFIYFRNLSIVKMDKLDEELVNFVNSHTINKNGMIFTWKNFSIEKLRKLYLFCYI